jgi:2-polyprenyl-3-methyl-5-hydroxy-6-metoxy-1,4-benzoquinol methylase
MDKFIRYPRYLFRKQLAIELVKKYIPRGAHFLEVGCASGDFGMSLSKLGYSGLLIDFSEAAAEIVINSIKNRFSNLTFDNKDIFDLHGEKGKYDFVVVFEVLEHIKNDEEVIEKIYELLKPNGFILLSVPARMKLWDIDDEGAGHFRRYEKKKLINVLQGHDFEIKSFNSYGYPFMNLLKPLRVTIFKQQQRHGKYIKEKRDQTKKSGINIIKIPMVCLVSNKFILYPFIQFSKMFNSLDKGEGYLCLAKKVKR